MADMFTWGACLGLIVRLGAARGAMKPFTESKKANFKQNKNKNAYFRNYINIKVLDITK